MKLANESAEMTSRVLRKCADEIEPAGPWRWMCAVQNGTRLQVAARFEEGFLSLACLPDEIRTGTCGLEDALLGNGTLAGGVKLAFDYSSGRLRLQTDIAVLDEKQLADRLWWAINGFHDGCRLLQAPASGFDHSVSETTESGDALGELLRETSWASAERAPNDYSIELDHDIPARARIRMSKTGVVSSLELVRAKVMAETNRQALAVFLLSATGALRLVRAYAEESDAGWCFGMQVGLPPSPAVEEIDHALAALTAAHRMCARETSVLLDDSAARRYLAARDPSTINNEQKKES